MNRRLAFAAFAAGAAVVGWIAVGYASHSPLGLVMTLLIAAVYAAGARELWRFEQATQALRDALATLTEAPPSLDAWLATLPAPLRPAVRARVEGARSALPGPALTPYLVGLLVLLGMLGTFLGMVATLQGAVTALGSTTDLATLRAALTAPVRGLGLAFGSSVAGVAASAMLGLVSALARRERARATQALDVHIATTLHGFSRTHQREQTLLTLQQQAQAMPALVAQVQTLVQQLDRHSAALHERLLAGQDRFHAEAQAAYAGLAASVDRSLKSSLLEGVQAAGAELRPLVQATLAGIAQDSLSLQQRMAAELQQTAGALTAHLAQQSAALAARAEQQASELVQQLRQTHTALQADAATADRQRLAAWTASLAELGAAQQQAWQQASSSAQAQQAQICRTLEQTAQQVHAQAEAQARRTAEQLAQLMATAAEAPRAAAEVVAALREKLSDSLARDNGLLEERHRLMADLGALLDSVQRAASEQRGVVEGLVASSAALLQQLGAQFGERVAAETARLGETAAQITGSAVEVASLGEAFGSAVQQFGETSSALGAQLQRIEAALAKSTARSDEQLAYYVAQARELIDLSLSSQQQIVTDLRQLAAQRAPLADEPA